MSCNATEPEEELGALAQPVWNGSNANDELYEYVGAVDTSSEDCTGTLVTPRWVLTAEHCVADDTEATDNGSYVFDLSAIPGSNPARRFTKGAGGLVRRYIETGDQGDHDHDMALFRLNGNVPPAIAEPLHPPTTPFSCAGSFPGRYVGYGVGHDWLLCDNVERRKRYSAPLTFHAGGDTLGRSSLGDGVTACFWYEGQVAGDSGGPVLRESNGTLCGVISDVIPYATGYPPLLAPSEFSTRTDLGAIGWFIKNLIDANGNWHGECSPPNPINDPDNDGIPSACDTCPRVWNPEQTTIVYDLDNDGIDDNCDFCLGTPGGNELQPNANMKYEASRFWDLAEAADLLDNTGDEFIWGPQHIDRAPLIAIDNGDAFDRNDAMNLLRSVWRPDACDAGPMPGIDIDYGGGITLDPATPNPQCPVLNPVIFNELTIQTAHSGATAGSGLAIQATVGLRFCACPSGMTERECQTDSFLQCSYDREEYNDPESLWRQLTTTNQFGSNPMLGAEFGAFLAVPPAPIYWDFTQLPSSALYGSLDSDIQAKGIVWTSILALSPNTVVPAPDVQRANGYSRPVPRAYYDCPQPGTEFKSYDELAYCPSCPYASALSAIEEVINPSGEVEIVRSLLTERGGFWTETVLEPNVLGYEGLLDGTLSYIPASEPPGVIAHLTDGDLITGLLDSASASYAMVTPSADTPSVPILLDGGAAAANGGGTNGGGSSSSTLTSTTSGGPPTGPKGPPGPASGESALFGSPDFVVATDGTKSVATPAALTIDKGPPPGTGGGVSALTAVSSQHDAYAFSSTEYYVFKLGERMLVEDTWHAFGRRQNLDTGIQDIVDFGPSGPFVVETAVYRRADRAIYFIENDGGTRYLSRWHGMFNYDATDALERLAEFGTGWDGYTRMWIAVTSLGELVVLGSTETSGTRPKAGAAWLTLDGADMLTDAQFKTVSYAARSGMRADHGGLVFTVGTSAPRAEHWGVAADLGSAPPNFELIRLFDSVVLDGN